MGRDKALIEIDGSPLAQRVADVLGVGGASPVAYVGGSAVHEVLAGPHIADVPGVEGPAAGLLAALRWSPEQFVVVAACDLVHIAARLVRSLREAVAEPGVEVAMVRWQGRPQPHLAVWSRTASEHVGRQIERGERAVWRLLPPAVRWIDLVDVNELIDVDHPEELGRWARPTKG